MTKKLKAIFLIDLFIVHQCFSPLFNFDNKIVDQNGAKVKNNTSFITIIIFIFGWLWQDVEIGTIASLVFSYVAILTLRKYLFTHRVEKIHFRKNQQHSSINNRTIV